MSINTVLYMIVNTDAVEAQDMTAYSQLKSVTISSGLTFITLHFCNTPSTLFNCSQIIMLS